MDYEAMQSAHGALRHWCPQHDAQALGVCAWGDVARGGVRGGRGESARRPGVRGGATAVYAPPPPHEIGARTSIELGELGGGTRFHAAGSVVKVVSDLVDALRRLPPSGVPPRHLGRSSREARGDSGGGQGGRVVTSGTQPALEGRSTSACLQTGKQHASMYARQHARERRCTAIARVRCTCERSEPAAASASASSNASSRAPSSTREPPHVSCEGA